MFFPQRPPQFKSNTANIGYVIIWTAGLPNDYLMNLTVAIIFRANFEYL